MRRGICTATALLALAACSDAATPAPVAKPPAAPAAAPASVPVAAVPEPPGVSADLPTTEPERTIAAVTRENPAFHGVKFTTASAAPFVVLHEIQQADVRDTKRAYDATTGTMLEEPIDGTVNPAKVEQNRLWTRKGNLLAQRGAVLLTELHRRFREEFAEALRLPAPGPKDGAITFFVAWKRESFDRILADLGRPVPSSVRTVYLPVERETFTYVGEESFQAKDVVPCAGGFAQKTGDQTLLYGASDRLLAGYAALLRGSTFDADAPDADTGPMWFRAGFGELMSAVEVEQSKMETLSGVTWRHERLRLDSVLEARRQRGLAERWTIEQLLKPNTAAEVIVFGQRIEPGSGGMTSLFAVRSWALCHYLRHYDGGRYRPQFLEWLRVVMTGTPTANEFARIMGRPHAADWGPLEREFEWYWMHVLARKVGRSHVTGEWSEPSTEPPAGRVEEDPEFCELWEARKPK